MNSPTNTRQAVNACAVKDCARPAKAGDLCGTHRDRKSRGLEGWDGPIRAWRRNVGQKCAQAGCSRPATCRGLCRLHWQRTYYGIDMGRRVQSRLKAPKRLSALSLPVDVFEALKGEAEARGLTVSEVARDALTAVMRARKQRRREYLTEAAPRGWTPTDTEAA